MIFFFFSSRRRHTRSLCDWSSDVCSSDLVKDRRSRAMMRTPATTSSISRRPSINKAPSVKAFATAELSPLNLIPPPGNLHKKCWPFLLTAMVILTVFARILIKTAAAESAKAAATLPLFTNITREAGLDMKIIDGDAMTEYLTDVNGEGACFLDYNNDGYQDIFRSEERRVGKEGR